MPIKKSSKIGIKAIKSLSLSLFETFPNIMNCTTNLNKNKLITICHLNKVIKRMIDSNQKNN
jgi:hypothetical protein